MGKKKRYVIEPPVSSEDHSGVKKALKGVVVAIASAFLAGVYRQVYGDAVFSLHGRGIKFSKNPGDSNFNVDFVHPPKDIK